MIDIAKLSRRYEVRRMGADDADAILAFCRENDSFYRYCSAEPSRERVLEDLRLTPPGVEASRKHYVGFFDGETLAAILDLIDGYPDEATAYIGFFMMNKALQGRGIGTGIIGEVCAHLKETGKTAVRLAIAEDNPQARHFWRKNGFRVLRKAPMDGWTALVAEREV